MDTLTSWARQLRRANWPWLPRQFRVRVSGSYVDRLRSLRRDLVVLGGGDYYTDEGYIGTSWTAHYRVKVFIEPDGVGGMSVWSRARMDFHEDSIIRGHGLGHTTVSSIMDAAEEAGVVEYYNMDKEGLQAMLDRFQVAA